ncbi:flagellar basal body-associated FliL family protein [Hydrogenophaga sp. 5NK40-0174]|uniref:flagellar basal body-associated FliL family protein n=1 Tax=Hydrogenophaga sp. 5NK40-0174 TaxID=3127649 RepID=UPI003105A295
MSDAAAATADASAAKPKKSKKMLFIILGVVLLLGLVAGGGALYMIKANTTEEGDHEAEEEEVHYEAPDPGTPPTFLPLESMVVNLADPGGNRYAQLGITLQLQDAATEEAIKVYMPTIRNGILLIISQRTSEQMLGIEGKEKLARDIIAEIAHVMGYQVEEPEGAEEADRHKRRKRRRAPPNPVQEVLFSSFIIQ